jgi:hypothetical protein
MSTSLKKATSDILNQLTVFLQQLPEHLFSVPLPLLSENTIGKHIRHIIEFYECVFTGSSTGIIAYDARVRDIRLENDQLFCIDKLHYIASLIELVDTDKKLRLQVSLTADSEPVCIDTSLLRELVYTIEHAVHHMAIIKIAVRSTNTPVEIPYNFGVAFSTIKHQAFNCSTKFNK